MRFQVPQFIEVENKIFGPLTLKQFIYLAGGAGMCVALWYIAPKIVAIMLIAPIAVLALALAFYKINDRPFIFFLESMFKYAISNKLYIWKKTDKLLQKKAEQEKQKDASLYVPKMSDSKLKDMTWNLGVSEETLNPVTRDKDSNEK